MQSKITSKFQTTIPKVIRQNLKLSVHDTLEWKIEQGRIIVYPAQKDFLKFRNAIKLGQGNIFEDIKQAREQRASKHK
jgi:AbrB family looped-hinge helix DNA binding protein